MNSDWIEEGWRRFLDRLKELWGKRTNPKPVILTNRCPGSEVLSSRMACCT